MSASSGYPANLTVDYPEVKRNRLTAFFRPFTVIPIAILLGLLVGPAAREGTQHYAMSVGGVVFLPTMLMLVIRQKYPRWWFDWNLALASFAMRVWAYMALLRDEYPSTDLEQAVHLDLSYPDTSELSRWLPLVKWLLAIPHYVVLGVLGVAVVCCVIIAWFTILVTGRYPLSLFEFVAGVFRWAFRVCAYAFLLATDRYPPFTLAQ